MNLFSWFLQKIGVLPSIVPDGDPAALYPDGRRATVATYQAEELHAEPDPKWEEFCLLIGSASSLLASESSQVSDNEA